MPKIIEDIKKRILNEAKKQVIERGYEGTTVRSVASKCGIAVGTLYNYYPSKDNLIAMFMLEDWLQLVEKIKKECNRECKPSEIFAIIHNCLEEYRRRYNALFSDRSAENAMKSDYYSKHIMLRSQISDLLMPLCKTRFTADFIAESLLVWHNGECEFSSLNELLCKLI